MDFIFGFPKTRKGNGEIFVIVDIFSKMAHFIHFFKTSDSTHVTNVFFNKIMRLHGVSKSIVSDQDTRFLGHI